MRPSGFLGGAAAAFDGDLCRDNAFGANVLPFLKIGQTNPEVGLDEAIAKGGVTYLLRLHDLVLDPDDPYAPGELYLSSKGDVALGIPDASPPQERSVDTSTAAAEVTLASGKTEVVPWPADGALALPTGGTYRAMTSTIRFPLGYLRDHTWVSGPLTASPELLPLPLGGFRGLLQADGFVLVVELDPSDHRKALRSQLAAVVSPGELASSFTSPSSGLFTCSAVPASTLAAALQEAADVKGGAFQFREKSVVCDRLSLDIGLQWVPTRIAEFPRNVSPTHFECMGGQSVEVADGAGGSGGSSGASGSPGKM